MALYLIKATKGGQVFMDLQTTSYRTAGEYFLEAKEYGADYVALIGHSRSGPNRIIHQFTKD
jgi:hypothetical protein